MHEKSTTEMMMMIQCFDHGSSGSVSGSHRIVLFGEVECVVHFDFLGKLVILVSLVSVVAIIVVFS